MITFTSSGSFDKTETFLKRMSKSDLKSIMNKAGAEGVEALAKNTPIDSGLTAHSWSYKVTRTSKSYRIDWFNDNGDKANNVAILIQYGHGTRNGGYVQGVDYINPVMQPIFERITAEIWREVTK